MFLDHHNLGKNSNMCVISVIKTQGQSHDINSSPNDLSNAGQTHKKEYTVTKQILVSDVTTETWTGKEDRQNISSSKADKHFRSSIIEMQGSMLMYMCIHICT